MNEPKFDIKDPIQTLALANHLEHLDRLINTYIDIIGKDRVLQVVANAFISHDEAIAEKLLEMAYSQKNDRV